MNSILSAINTYNLSRPRRIKFWVLLAGDFLIALCSLWLAFALRFSDFWPSEYLRFSWPQFFLVPIGMVGSLALVGFYRGMIRHIELDAMRQLFLASMITVFFAYAIALVFRLEVFPRSIPLIFGLLTIVLIALSRGIALSYFRWAIGFGLDRERILVIGRLDACLQVASAIKRSGQFHVVGLIDIENNKGNSISGFRTLSLSSLKIHIREGGIDSLVVALDALPASEQKILLNELSEYNLRVRLVPSINEFLKDDSIQVFRDVELVDLLGRDQIAPLPSLVRASVTSQVVMVTGAGGSIGSEICRQSVSMGVRRLILIETSEYNLYSITAELDALAEGASTGAEIIPCLCSVLDRSKLKQLMVAHRVNTVYHAAAYKHVPLLESNSLMAFMNNSVGSWAAAKAAVDASVERFVLVSTDKAVRPTNVMGASKRLAELAIETIAKSQSQVLFSAVRFGNVLGSSGSVIPLFTRQIQSGGPVTITDPAMTRYFMTIPEAASLVIQAGSINESWAIFVLDMGEPVSIMRLAEQMIHLSGHVIRDDVNPSGISIKTIGIRPGEKLYEELSISGKLEPTIHPKISVTTDSFDDLDAVRIDRIMTNLSEGMIAVDSDLISLLKTPSVSYSGSLDICFETHSKI